MRFPKPFMPRFVGGVLAAALLVAVPACAAPTAKAQPSAASAPLGTPAGRQAAALLQVFNEGNGRTMLAFIKETAKEVAAGAKEMFGAWWAFAEAKASGIAFLALAVAVISGNEAQSSERAVPAWSAWIAMVSAVASFAGWALGRWFGVDFGNLLWVASSVLMSVWTLWFGFALMRSRVNVT